MTSLDPSGGGSTPLGVTVGRSTSQTGLTINTANIINWELTTIDNGGWWNPATPGVITVPAAANNKQVILTGYCALAAGSMGVTYGSLVVGSTPITWVSNPAYAVTMTHINVVALWKAVTGQQFTFRVNPANLTATDATYVTLMSVAVLN